MSNQLQSPVTKSAAELKKINVALEKEIRERVQIEAQLRDSEEKFRNLLQSAPDAIVIIDESGSINLINDQTEKLLGYSAEELNGQPVEILIPQIKRNTHIAYRKQYFTNPYTRPMGDGLELHALKKNGETIPVEISLSPLSLHKKVLVTAAIRDVSKRKQVEQELMEYREHLEELIADRTAELTAVNKELEAFSYTISHDLRAPLRSIDGFSLALLEDCQDQLDQPAKIYLHRIRSAAQRMGRLIDEVLGLARVNRVDICKKPLDLSKMVKDIVSDLHVNEPDRRVEVTIEQGLTAKVDENLFRVVLENLMDNAWKFTANKERAHIQFTAKCVKGIYTYFIVDNGAGFDMQYKNKLFKPFQRLHDEKEFPGTGVGLATVHRIIQRHGGSIWVDSATNKGTTVYFSLPE